MALKKNDLDALVQRIGPVIAYATKNAYPVKHASVLWKSINELTVLHDELRRVKALAINQQNEDVANHFLGFQAMVRSVREELRMWCWLKKNKPDKAWISFVESEEWAYLALRTPASNESVERHIQRLSEIERSLFPNMMFASAGFEHAPGKCSICRAEFHGCEHVAGKIYCGQVCAEVGLSELRMDHVSIVTSPRDKRCHITAYGTSGKDGWTDFLTGCPSKDRKKWKGKENPTDADKTMFSCIAITASEVPGVGI